MMKAAPAPVMLLFALSLALNLWLAGVPGWTWLLAALSGWYLADMASGVVHLVMDYYPCRSDVGLGAVYSYEGSRESDEYLSLRAAAMARIGGFQKLAYDFKNHHPRPDALGRRSMLVQIGSTICFTTLPTSLAVNLIALAVPLPGWLLFGAVIFLIGATFAQYFHGTLHRMDNPWIVRAMRRVGLLMTPQAHAIHHATLTQDFATNTGWSNPVVNRLFRLAMRRRWLTEAGLEPR